MEANYVYAYQTKKWLRQPDPMDKGTWVKQFDQATPFPSIEMARHAIQGSFFPPTEEQFDFLILGAREEVSVKVRIEKDVQMAVGRKYE